MLFSLRIRIPRKFKKQGFYFRHTGYITGQDRTEQSRAEQNRTEQNCSKKRTEHGTDETGNLCPKITAPGTNPIEGVNHTTSRGQENRAVHSAAEASPPSSPHTG